MHDYKNACRKIWRGYQTYAKGASVIRTGFESIGASVVANDSLNLNKTFFRRGESILEHQAKTAWLASVFMSNFPDYFGIETTHKYSMGDWLIIITALCHDVGELEIGDIPDDGNPLHDAKDETELLAFADFIKAYSYVDQGELFKLFDAFQQKNSNAGRALYALDKTEAVLTNLLLEKHGIKGSLENKKNPTSRDLFFAKAIGSELAADIWGAQMSARIKGYPPYIAKPIFTLLNTAAYDVRGEEFSWAQDVP